jgi:hypothetical protein
MSNTSGTNRNADPVYTPTALLPFIPGGADFQKTRALFRELGFAETWDAGDYVGMEWGGAKFILQNFNDEHFAQNIMIKLEVADLDAWWAIVEPKRLAEKFPGFRINPPTTVPWGREVAFIDVAGVCWHVS